MTQKQKTPDRRVVKTKRAIRSAFSRLMTEKNINDITVSDIAELADINRKTFYNYYAGVYAIVDEIEDEIVRRFDELLTDIELTSNAARPYMLFGKLTAIVNTDTELFGILLSMNPNVSLSTKLVEMLKAKTKTVLQKYLDTEEHKLDLMLEFMVTGIVAVYRRWFNSDRSQPVDQISADINLLIFEGLKGYLNIDLDDV